MKRIYMDNGATSYPKAPGVADAMSRFITDVGCNVGRGAYAEAFEAQRLIWELREMLCGLFDGPDPKNVIFTMNITQSMNMLLKGVLKSGDHVLISPMEHNAVLRPIHQLTAEGISYDLLPADSVGRLVTTEFESYIKPNTKAIICTHASNVCGTINPLEKVGEFAKANKLWFIVDAAQTAGVIPISMKNIQADAIAFTGHKGLLGPQGVGGFVLTQQLSDEMTSLITGGTGSHSESEIQPEFLPDKFESGTPNTVGLYGLHAAIKYVLSEGMDQIFAHELSVTERFISGIQKLDGVRLIGEPTMENRTAVVSLDFEKLDNAEVSYLLEKHYAIATRVGMHCAPLAHKHLNTFPKGTVRFSFSYFNTNEEIDQAIEAVQTLLNEVEE